MGNLGLALPKAWNRKGNASQAKQQAITGGYPMRYSVNKLRTKTRYLVKYHDELVIECSDLAEIPLMIKDLLDHGELPVFQAEALKIVEETELDFYVDLKATYEVSLKIQ